MHAWSSNQRTHVAVLDPTQLQRCTLVYYVKAGLEIARVTYAAAPFLYRFRGGMHWAFLLDKAKVDRTSFGPIAAGDNRGMERIALVGCQEVRFWWQPM